MEYEWYVGEIIWCRNPDDPTNKKRPAVIVGTDDDDDALILIFGTSQRKSNSDFVEIHDEKLPKTTYFNSTEVKKIKECVDFDAEDERLGESNTMKLMEKVTKYFPELRNGIL